MDGLRAGTAFVSREVYPFGGGGLGGYVTATAALLAQVGPTAIFTTTLHRPAFERLRAAGDPRVPSNVEFVFVPEPTPEDVGPFFHPLHAWSRMALDAVQEHYGSSPPALLEFPDYQGEGVVAAQARVTESSWLERTTLAVRLYTSSELCDVLNARLPVDTHSRFLFDLERYALRFVDVVVGPSPHVIRTYERYYGAAGLAASRIVPHPLGEETSPSRGSGRARGSGLRLLYLGRFERRKGVLDLVRAVSMLDPALDVLLTLVGGDTNTALLGGSMRGALQHAAARDPRIVIRGPVDRREVPSLLATHDALIAPSRWECWPTVALEALASNRPVLATPVGGYLGMIEHERSGWLATATGMSAIGDLIEHIAVDPDALRASSERRLPRARADALTDPELVVDAYSRLSEVRPTRRRRSSRRPQPLVSIVVPYYRLSGFVAETVQSAFAQTYRPIEVIVVNDGSFDPADRVLEELAARLPIAVLSQENAGLGGARNFGIEQSRGKYFLPLDADNTIDPEFVARAVCALEADPDIAYVTTWSVSVDEDGAPLDPGPVGYRPLSNAGPTITSQNSAGDAVAVVRRSVFDRGHRYRERLKSYEDWFFYRQLGEAGLIGHVIPEPLLRYRVRQDSMFRTTGEPRERHLREEMTAMARREAVQWTS